MAVIHKEKDHEWYFWDGESQHGPYITAQIAFEQSNKYFEEKEPVEESDMATKTVEVPCLDCDGSGYADCPTCGADGYDDCDACGGMGYTEKEEEIEDEELK